MANAIADYDRDADCPIVNVPAGFAELTYQLAWWCDAGPFTIDPTPLTDCHRFVEQAAAAGRVENGDGAREAFDDFGDAYTAAIPVFNRMITAAAIKAGIEPPERINPVGRPRDKLVARRREKVLELSERGLSPGEIAAELRQWAADKHVSLSVEIVKKDIDRV
jgi:hypothetical protein